MNQSAIETQRMLRKKIRLLILEVTHCCSEMFPFSVLPAASWRSAEILWICSWVISCESQLSTPWLMKGQHLSTGHSWAEWVIKAGIIYSQCPCHSLGMCQKLRILYSWMKCPNHRMLKDCLRSLPPVSEYSMANCKKKQACLTTYFYDVIKQ